MEGEAVVEALAGELREVVDGLRGVVGEELDLDGPFARVHDCACHRLRRYQRGLGSRSSTTVRANIQAQIASVSFSNGDGRRADCTGAPGRPSSRASSRASGGRSPAQRPSSRSSAPRPSSSGSTRRRAGRGTGRSSPRSALVVVFRGLVDLVFHRMIPWPSLFGLESPQLREEDVVARRRVWFWRFWLKVGDLVVAIATRRVPLLRERVVPRPDPARCS